ncbi:MAG TPA: hypothetical protein VK449_05005, partial [Anaerolineales bacterium]|nr:hypothetical protein [Anaerolineales bacterium]
MPDNDATPNLRVEQVESDPAWASILDGLPSAHLLQSPAWGRFKSHYGWTPERRAWRDAGGRPVAAAQVLRRWEPSGRRWASI